MTTPTSEDAIPESLLDDHIEPFLKVLRHRSQTTTAIYAQVSFEALRTVALAWPAAGGDR